MLLGTRILHRTVPMDAPSSWAASRISSGTARKLWVIRKVPKGANIAGKTSVHWVSSRPKVPKIRKLGTKVTCNGSTMTTSNRKKHRPFPGKLYLAKPNPARTDNTTWLTTIKAQRAKVLQNTSRYSGVARNTV